MAQQQDPGRTTVVVVTWRGREHLGACLDALAAQTRPHRTVVVDNASTDGTAAVLVGHPSRPAVLRLRRNAGYAGGLATALREVDTPFVAWLNDDTAPGPGWLAALEDALDADPGAAAAGSVLRRPDGSVQSVGVGLTEDGHGVDLAFPATVATAATAATAASAAEGVEVFGFCGGAALLRADVLRSCGGVPGRFFCYYEDTDTAWRLRLAGRRVLSVGAAEVRHRHGASSRLGSARFHRWNERNRLLMLLRCAPATTALRELARFALITVLLPVRRRVGRDVPAAANFRTALRLVVLAEVLLALPWVLRARRRITARAVAGRAAVWRAWAGRGGDGVPGARADVITGAGVDARRAGYAGP